MLGVELLVAGLVVLLAARYAWVVGHREEGEPITEAEARQNASPLTTAILASDHHHRKHS